MTKHRSYTIAAAGLRQHIAPLKTIIGYAFPVPGTTTDAIALMSSGPVYPFAHPFARNFQP